MNNHCYNLLQGTIGFCASVFGFISTFQHQFEWWVRVTGGMLGIFIACVTIYNMFKKKP